MSRGFGQVDDGVRRTSTTSTSTTTSTTSPTLSEFSLSSSVASEPIAIVPSSFPSPQQLFGPPSLSPSYQRDGPLRGLLPPFGLGMDTSGSSISGGSSSGDSAFLLQGLSPLSMTGSARAGTSASAGTRRVVSAPHHYSSSPRSPLAGGAFPPSTTNSATSPSLTTRRHSSQFPDSPTSPSSLHPSPKSQSRRRRSSVSLSTSVSASGTPFGSLVGTWENSLLTGRLSALPSLPLPFLSSIGVLGNPSSPTRLRCPPHLNLDFGAYFYAGPEGLKSTSPYVGTIDLESHYNALLRLHEVGSGRKVPRFPGYRIPQSGQIQLVIKNPNSTAIKLFLIPYDLTGIERGGKGGGKTFVRQKSYAVDENEEVAVGTGKGKLRYAVHLQFCCPPLSSTSTTGKKSPSAKEPQYYLYQTIRVVFASRALDSTEKLRVVAEGPEGVLGDDMKSVERYAEYRGPGLEWELKRKKVKGRERVWGLEKEKKAVLDPNGEVIGEGEEGEREGEEGEEEDEAIVADPNGTSDSFFRPRIFHRPLLSTPPSPPPLSPSLNMDELARALPQSKHLSFGIERPNSRARERTSALSSSRPGSRAGRAREGTE